MRIWYQSFGDLETLPNYRSSLEAHTSQVADAGTTVAVRGIRPGSYGPGLVPPIAFTRFPYLKYLNQLQIVDNALQAEDEGYDAFAIGCYHDPALREARSVVDIPVLSIGEASMLIACSFARRFGVITMCKEFADYTSMLVRDYGIETRLAGIEVMEPPLTEFDLENPGRVAREVGSGLEAAATSLRDKGAELLIPGDGNLNEALHSLSLSDAVGLPVMDAVAALVKLAECYAALHRRTGLTTSRASFYAKPNREQLEEVRARYGLAAVASRG